MAARAARARMKTSATDRPRPITAQDGFTLIELLVTLTLAGLLLALVPALSGQGGDRARLNAGARSVVAALALARSDAVMRNADSAFVLDLEQRRFGVVGAALAGSARAESTLAGSALDGALDPGLAVTMTAGAAASAARGLIRFHPNGGSDGGDVTLRNPAGAVTLRVDWLTGAVSVRPHTGDGRGA